MALGVPLSQRIGPSDTLQSQLLHGDPLRVSPPDSPERSGSPLFLHSRTRSQQCTEASWLWAYRGKD